MLKFISIEFERFETLFFRYFVVSISLETRSLHRISNDFVSEIKLGVIVGLLEIV